MLMKLNPCVNFIKLCLPSDKIPAHCFWQNSCSSILPTIDSHHFMQKSIKMFQIWVQFTKSVRRLQSPVCQKNIILLAQKAALECWWNWPRVQFHQRFLRAFFVQTSFLCLEFGFEQTFVWKIGAKNVDEIDHRCEFHQQFMSTF